MGASLITLMGWLAIIVIGIILILRGRDKHSNLLMALGALLIAVATVFSFVYLVL